MLIFIIVGNLGIIFATKCPTEFYGEPVKVR